MREFRGDAHVAALLTAGLDGLDAIVIHAATGNVPAAFLKLTRGWSDEQWDEDVELLRATGWLAPDEVDGNPVLSEEGTMLREEIESPPTAGQRCRGPPSARKGAPNSEASCDPGRGSSPTRCSPGSAAEAPEYCRCSGGRTRTPNVWTRTRCVADYTTPERVSEQA